jgi:hypothetical protein
MTVKTKEMAQATWCRIAKTIRPEEEVRGTGCMRI